ncbi:hypothetical protein RB595_004276 [Gaeumannomyces hyphopodioides]
MNVRFLVEPLSQTPGSGLPKRPLENASHNPPPRSPKRARSPLSASASASASASPATSNVSWQLDANADTPLKLPSTNGDIEMCDAPSAASPCIVVSAPAADPEPVICFGAIVRCPLEGGDKTGEGLDCQVKLDRRASLSKTGEQLRVSARAEPGSSAFHTVHRTDGVRLGMLDIVTGRLLKALDGIDGILFQAVIRSVDVQAKTNGILPVSINILGPESRTDLVGDRLASLNAYLQHPYTLDSGVEYLNPHFFQKKREYITHLVGAVEDSPEKMLSDEIEDVMASLSAGNLSGDTEYHDIATELKPHQKQGVEFILKREDPRYCRGMNEALCSSINANPGTVEAATGGIIADVMGMGKTLTIISAIVATKLESRRFVAQDHSSFEGRMPGPTLVILPSVQLMSVWQAEILRHVNAEGGIVVLDYHGPKRARSAARLLAGGSDIVLTTYSTVVEDHKRGQSARVLHNIEWYRVVLDEAHWVRNPSSKRFKAAKDIVSQRRWCLTGTPVQNSLRDLATLVHFLDIQPFARLSEFRSHILGPLGDASNQDRCRNLRKLLGMICLRRSSKCLHLPEERKGVIYIDQTEEEKEKRRLVEKECLKRMENLVSSGGRGLSARTKKYNIMFDVMMQLRRLCNNGTFRRLTGAGTSCPSSTDPVIENAAAEDLDGGPCEQCDGGELASTGEEYCSLCQRRVVTAPSSRTATPGSGAVRGRPVHSARALLGPFSPPGPMPCTRVWPRQQHNRGSWQCSLDSPPTGASPSVMDVDMLQPTPPPAMEWSGQSSKLETIVNNIASGSLGDKSIVFSFWTSTLDILEHLLELRRIRCVRIDGTVKAEARADIIKTFSDDPAIPVILLTIGCGAVGLTITAANRVHIVEPQWNPSVEEQAVARAVRMGQEREVAVLRYVVKGSVEKSIMSLQKKKSNLARFTIDGGENRMSGNLEDLRFVLPEECQPKSRA